MNDNFVYVMSDGENYKIGVSINPIERAKAIKIELRKPISLLLSINCKDAYGCERYLHNKYQHLNVGREWFSFPDQDFLKNVCFVCVNNIIDKTMFIAVDSKLKKTDDRLDSLVSNNLSLSYAFAHEQLSEDYNHVLLPSMLLNLGCKRVKRAKGAFYITPKGLEEGLDKQRLKIIKEVSNKVAN